MATIDNANFLPNEHAVSSDCLFSLKKSSVAGKMYRCSVPSTNGTTFTQQQTVILYVPAGRRNTFLDPSQTYLKYTIINNDPTGSESATLDRSGACVINSINIYHGSNLLESIQTYNVLYNYLLDTQQNFADNYGSSSAFGCGYIDNVAGSLRIGAVLGDASTATNKSRLTVAMPLISALLGLGSDKYLPLFALGDDIRIEILLEQTIQAFNWATNTAPSYQVTNVELELAMIELSDEGMSMVNSVTNFSNPVFLHGNSWRHFTASLAAGSSGNQSFILPARHASLKSVVILPRPTPSQIATAYSLACRVNPNIATYYFRVGGALIPQKPVTLYNNSNVYGYCEGYMEIIKSQHALSKANVGTVLGFDLYNVADTGDLSVGGVGVFGFAGATLVNGVGNVATQALVLSGQTSKCAFAIAQEFEMFAGKSDILISGTNTLSSQMFFEFNIVNATTYGYTLDMYSNFDIIFVLDQGMISARF